jgi:predicted dehydrogenase
MKFLIIGFGSIGRRHFRNLRALGENDILFYRTANSTLPGDEIAGYPVERDLDSALAHKPDGVIVANPTALHLDAAIPAAWQGCHILLEKPISHTRERIPELVRAVKEQGSKILVGYQFRYHPNLLQIKQLLADQYIGRPLSFRSHWGEYLPDWHPWEDYRQSYSAREDLGGGVILTLCHNFDYLRWLFGEGDVLWSILGYDSDLEIEAEDTAEIGLEFGDRIIGSLHLNYTQIPPRHTLEIVGTRGSISWDYHQNTVQAHRKMCSGELESQLFSCPDGFNRNDLFLDEMAHFLEVINGQAEPICSLNDGISALELALHAGEIGII